MKHILKEDPKNFEELWNARRELEIRFNDRDFKVGDDLVIAETRYSSLEMQAGKPLEYTGRAVTAEISEILMDEHGVKEGWCVLNLAIDNWHEDFSPASPDAEE